MRKEREVNKVIGWITQWLTEIDLKKAVRFHDINTVSEDLALKLLNEIYDYQLENLNYEIRNYPGIDLGDKTNKIGFQITSRKDLRKIRDSLGKFVKGPDKIFPSGIRFLILNDEKKPKLTKGKYQGIYPNFEPDDHILNGEDLIYEIGRIYDSDQKKFYRIKNILKVEYGIKGGTGLSKVCEERITIQIIEDDDKSYVLVPDADNNRNPVDPLIKYQLASIRLKLCFPSNATLFDYKVLIRTKDSDWEEVFPFRESQACSWAGAGPDLWRRLEKRRKDYLKYLKDKGMDLQNKHFNPDSFDEIWLAGHTITTNTKAIYSLHCKYRYVLIILNINISYVGLLCKVPNSISIGKARFFEKCKVSSSFDRSEFESWADKLLETYKQAPAKQTMLYINHRL